MNISLIRYFFLVIFLLLSITVFSPTFAVSPVQVIKLTCEHRENPLGIDTKQPLLSWQLQDSRRNIRQTAYQILVSSSEQKLQANQGDTWNSQKVNSEQSLYIQYAGAPLQSGKRYFWKVRTWDQDGKASSWSAINLFEMGLLQPAEWQGNWVARAEKPVNPPAHSQGNWLWHPTENRIWHMIYLRKSFTVPTSKTIKKATMRSAIAGTYEVRLNEQLVTNQREWVPSRGHRFYENDITPLIKPGANLLLIAANHTKNEQPGVILNCLLEFTDGTTQRLVTDGTWESTAAAEAGWRPEFPQNTPITKAKIIEPYGGNTWKQIGEPYIPPRSVMMRREFNLAKPIARARAYVSGLGSYYFHLNGKRVGEDILAPGWTHYPKRTQYQTYDVTHLLKSGENAAAAILGNGWWSSDMGFRGMGYYSEGPLRFLLQLQVTYTDGTTQTLVTDKNWQVKESPVVFNNMYDGETYDARLEIPGWDLPGLKASNWEPVVELQEAKNNLVAEQLQPIRVTQELQPVSVKEISPGRFIFDMGQNMVGGVRLRVQGPAGTKVTLRFAEILHPDGSLNTEPLRTAKATDNYILKGEGEETWEPRFTYHGFQFVEVTGYPGKPGKAAILGRVFHTDAPVIGQFTSSNSLLNKLHQNILWGQRGNMESVVTDCPQRDERMGWTGDAQIFAATAFYNMDMNLMFRKYMRDTYDGQLPDGRISNMNPNAFLQGDAGPGWADAMVIVPWRVYQFTGDKTVLEENYPYMVAWHGSLVRKSQHNLLEWGGFGDWVSVEKTPEKPIGSAYYFYSTKLLAQMAAALGKTDDARKYIELAASIAQAFNQTHLNPQTHNYWAGTQTANLLPLAFGIASPEIAPVVAKNIADNVQQKNIHVTTGFLGTQYILPMLSDYGYHYLAYQLATQRTSPSWGYMVDQGATTIWELWNSDKAGPDMNSRNHYAYGTVGEWFYKYLGGIRIDDTQPGFKHTIIAPKPAGDLTWVKSSYDSPYGTITSNWERTGDKLIMQVTIPANTTAEVHVPKKNKATSVYEGDKVLKNKGVLTKNRKGVTFLREEKEAVVFAVGSGSYVFKTNL